MSANLLPIAIIPTALLTDKRLPSAAKTIAGLVFASATDAGRWCAPKQVEMGEFAGVSRETANRHIKLLVSLGYMETRNRTTATRGRVSLEYRLKLDLSAETLASSMGHHIPTGASDVTKSALKKADVTKSAPKPDLSEEIVTLKTPTPPSDVTKSALPKGETPSVVDNLQREVVGAASADASDFSLTNPGEPKRGCRIPKGWKPSKADLAFAAEQGFYNGTCAKMAEEFFDYWVAVPGKAGVKADWSATWRNHVRRQADFRAKRGGSKEAPNVRNGVYRRPRPAHANA